MVLVIAAQNLDTANGGDGTYWTSGEEVEVECCAVAMEETICYGGWEKVGGIRKSK